MLLKSYYDTRKIEMLKLHLNKNLKVNRQENENEYNELLYKFDELDFKNKNSLNKNYILMKNITKKYLLNYVIYLDIKWKSYKNMSNIN